MQNPKLHALLPYISEERLTKFDDALQQRTRRLCMVLENIYQSRNASAVMRSCAISWAEILGAGAWKWSKFGIPLASASAVNTHRHGELSLTFFEQLKKYM